MHLASTTDDSRLTFFSTSSPSTNSYAFESGIARNSSGVTAVPTSGRARVIKASYSTRASNGTAGRPAAL